MTAWEYRPDRWQELAAEISREHTKKRAAVTAESHSKKRNPDADGVPGRQLRQQAPKGTRCRNAAATAGSAAISPGSAAVTPAVLPKESHTKPMYTASAEVTAVPAADFLLCFRKNTLAGETTPRNLAEQELLEVLATLTRQYKSLRLISADLTAVLTLVGTPERAARFMTAHAAGSILPCHAPGDAPAVATWEAPHVEESRRDGTPHD